MYLVFYRTSDVFEAEELLQDRGVATSIVPTPVQDKAYCGVSVKISPSDKTVAVEILEKFDYKLIQNQGEMHELSGSQYSEEL